MVAAKRSDELVLQNAFLTNHADLVSRAELQWLLCCASSRLRAFAFLRTKLLIDELVQSQFPFNFICLERLNLLAEALRRADKAVLTLFVFAAVLY